MPDTKLDNIYVIGVDVGTGSARAGLFDFAGSSLASAIHPIQTWRPRPDWAEQSSTDIWNAVCVVVNAVVCESGVPPEQIRGIGYDATCSLVILDAVGAPLPVSPGADAERDTILWMDHRAVDETDEINAGGYDVLKYVGGKLSPEMEIPKLLWLKRHCRDIYARAGRFFDLADFLSYRSTGANIRSECTTVCKWTYLAHERRWDESFLSAIGLDDLIGERIGRSGEIRPIGSLAGLLTESAAKQLGLSPGTAVAVGAIDAHAGGIGLLGSVWEEGAQPDVAMLESALALIGGTSSCHMAVSREPRFIPGVWGPYFGAMTPGAWLTEGGQSATGALIDFTIDSHPAKAELAQSADRLGITRYELLNHRVQEIATDSDLPYPALLTRDLHLLDYHLGNRSPIGDPRARGVVDGLSFDTSLDGLALLYLAAIQSVAYGTRAIVEALNVGGYAIDQILVTGGGTKNPLWLREHADAVGVALKLPREPESVLLGSAILAAVASGAHADIPHAMQAMAHTGETISPNPQAKRYHDTKYECYRSLYREQIERRRQMAEF